MVIWRGKEQFGREFLPRPAPFLCPLFDEDSGVRMKHWRVGRSIDGIGHEGVRATRLQIIYEYGNLSANSMIVGVQKLT